jgi:hypothetical protein
MGTIKTANPPAGSKSRRFQEVFRAGFDQVLFQLVNHAVAVRRVDTRAEDCAGSFPFDFSEEILSGTAQVDLIDHDDGRHLPFPGFLQNPFFIVGPQIGLDEQDDVIGPVEDLFGFFQPGLRQNGSIIETGRIEKDHRPQGEKLHGLFDHVRGRPGDG